MSRPLNPVAKRLYGRPIAIFVFCLGLVFLVGHVASMVRALKASQPTSSYVMAFLFDAILIGSPFFVVGKPRSFKPGRSMLSAEVWVGRTSQWESYDYLGSDDLRVILGVVSGEIDIEAVAALLSKVYSRSYLLALNDSLKRRECPASDCQEYRGYLVAGEPGAALIVNGELVTCSRCRRTCRLDHFDGWGRNRLAVFIGGWVSTKGGLALMEAVAKRFEPSRKFYVLSHSWDRVGEWLADQH